MLNIITNGYVLPFLSKPNLVRFPLIISEYKALPKDQALADCIQSLLSKNAIERVENVKSLGFYSRLFRVPKPHQRWRPVIDLSRLNTFLHVEKFKMETPVLQNLPDSRGMGCVNRSIGRLPSHPHPSSLKEIPKILPQVSGVPVHLPTFRTGHSPPGLYHDRKGGEAHGPLQRSQTPPIPGRLAGQVSVVGGSPREHSGSGRCNPVLGMDLNPTQLFSFMGYEYHLDSALVKPTQERWLKLQDLILHLKSKHVLTARCLMSLIGLLASTEKMVPEG